MDETNLTHSLARSAFKNWKAGEVSLSQLEETQAETRGKVSLWVTRGLSFALRMIRRREAV